MFRKDYMIRTRRYYKRNKYLLLDIASTGHIKETTLADIAVVLLGMMYSFTACTFVLLLSHR